MRDIEESVLCKEPATNLIDLVDQFDSVLHELLNIHAPVVTKTVTVRSQAPWFTDDLRMAKQCKRRAERKVCQVSAGSGPSDLQRSV